MSFSLSLIRADIDEFLKETVFPGQTVYKQSISDTTILGRDAAGKVIPYVAYQAGDLEPWGSETFAGAAHDDYALPLYIKIVVPGNQAGIDTGESLYDKCIQRFLGVSFPWAGNIRKRLGGVSFPLRKSDGSTEAVVFPVSFRILVQLATIPDGP